MKDELTDDEKHIVGYNMILPRTTEVQRIVRLVMLVREDMTVGVMNEYIDNTLVAVWVKIGAQGRKPMLLGAVYREHQCLQQPKPNVSKTDQQQYIR